MKYNTKATLRMYWHEARQSRLLIFFMLIGVVGGSSLGVVIPLYFKKFFDVLTTGVNPAETVPTLIRILGTIALLETVRWAFWRVATFVNTRFQPAVMARLGNRCFAYLHKHSFSYFSNNFVGSLVKRVNWFTRAFETVADKITWNLTPLFIELGIIVYVLFQKSPLLGVGSLLWLALFLTVNLLFTWFKLRYEIERNVAETKLTGILADTITNNSNVKLFVGYGRECGYFGRAIDKVRNLRTFTWTLDAVFEAVQGFLVVAFELGIFYFAIQLWAKQELTLGDFVLLQAYTMLIFDKVWDFGKIVRQLYSDLADAEEMTVIFNTPHEIKDIPAAKPLVVSAGAVVFKNVDFYYHETRRIFSKLNLNIASHEKVALVGPSGAGKSTVVKLLMRMHDISAGSISIDGQKIGRITQESLWQAISMVPQDPVLFHRTLLENIRYGRPEATDAEVFKASKLAHCDEFILEFPDKYNTYVGERGMKLSGGERQRVAIARAILRDAPILVLDEATSSLDSESEALIQDALKYLMRDKTVIVIAHRLSTIMTMDRIIVVDRGAIVEAGTHAQLLKKKKGIYNGLWKIQAGGFLHDKKERDNTESGLDEKAEKDYDDESISD